MTELLQKVFDMASRLPKTDQEAFAKIWIGEMESEKKWQELFSQSHDLLEMLADEALAEHRAGKTQQLGWGNL